MALFSGSCSGRNTRVNQIANRTEQSRGSVGGIKKSGIFGGSVSWPQGNMGRTVFRRAPQTTHSISFNTAHTTRHPVTRRYARYGVISGIF